MKLAARGKETVQLFRGGFILLWFLAATETDRRRGRETRVPRKENIFEVKLGKRDHSRGSSGFIRRAKGVVLRTSLSWLQKGC